MPLAQYLEGVVTPASDGQDLQRKYDVPPPIARDSETGHPWYPEYYTSEASRWSDDIYRASVAQLADDSEIREVQRYIDLLMGKHWPAERPTWKARPVVNKMLKYHWEATALLTDIQMSAGVHSDNPDKKDTAEKLNKARHANWQAQDADVSLMFTVMHAMLGLGWMKVISPGRDNDDIGFMPCGSDSVIPILGNLIDFQRSAGVIYRSWQPMQYFGRRSPGLAHLIKPEAAIDSHYFGIKPYGVSEYSWTSASPGLKGWLKAASGGVEGSEGYAGYGYGRLPVSLLTEFWFKDPQVNTSLKTLRVGYGNFQYLVKPGEPIYPFGRLIVTAGESARVVMWDGPNPHWHALFPFAPLRLQPVPWMWSGMSEYRALWPLNNAINTNVADVLDLFKGVINPSMIVAEGSIADATWDNYFPGMPSAKLKLLAKSRPLKDLIEWIRPDAAGLAAFPAIIGILLQLFDQQSGMLDVHRLMGKKQAPSGDTIAQARETQQGSFRLKGRLMEAFMRQVGRLQISDILQFYGMKKMISLFGAAGLSFEQFDWDPGNMVPSDVRMAAEPFRRGNEYVKGFRSLVGVGTSLPSQRWEKVTILNALRARHDVDRETMLESVRDAGVHLPPTDVIEARLKKEVPMMMPKGKKGGGAGLPTGI